MCSIISVTIGVLLLFSVMLKLIVMLPKSTFVKTYPYNVSIMFNKYMAITSLSLIVDYAVFLS